MTHRKIVVLATGGTIAGRAASASDDIGYTAGQVGVDDLMASVAVPAGTRVVAEQVAQLDSKDMSFDTWRALASRCRHWLSQADVDGIVVTHGTDTVEETAYLLHRVLPAAKPVVLTCAMRPATSLAADGPRNVADAIRVAATEGARGVVLVCAGEIHDAVHVAKEHTSRLDAFTSGEAGPVGFVEDGKVRLDRAWPRPPEDACEQFQAFDAAAAWPRVEVVMNYAGASGAMVEALVQQGIDGIVAAGTGNGTLHHDLEAALVRAREKGVAITRSTRCALGGVTSHPRDTLADSNGLSPVKARVDLLLRLVRSAG